MKNESLYTTLTQINQKPEPYALCTAESFWNYPHISKKMLMLHLDPKAGLASRNENFVRKSTAWITSHFDLNKNSMLCDFGCRIFNLLFFQHF